MERFVKGEVVVLPFPLSDLSTSKKRPALVAATLEGNDMILCQITSEQRFDDYSISLEKEDFIKSGLKLKSWIRPNRLFTADKSIIRYKVGFLKKEKMLEVTNKICEIFKK